MQVRIVREQPPERCRETDYLRVHTFSDPGDDTVTLTTIERVVERTNVVAERSKPALRVKTLITKRRMSPNDALELAKSYAQWKNISVVYAAL